MRFTSTLVTCLAAAMALSITACGGDDSEDNPSGGSAGQGAAGQGVAGQGSAGQGNGTSCDMAACLSCLMSGSLDCVAEACAGCEDEESGGAGEGGGEAGNSNGPQIPEPECTRNDQCGISFECLSCGLTDGEGWCFQTEECHFDDDCGVDGKCGYNVETGDYRCLPEENCP